jgi:hypothetical protein
MKLQVTPSRILNDQRGIFGLWLTDFAAAILIFVFVSGCLDDTGFGILALPASLVSLAVLSPIRLNNRRKIVRDTLSYYLTPKAPRHTKARRTNAIS